ncbi:helix-turn-helix domain-containing protein [Streptomyces physcomitrii]|uniref:Helix-turn-helix transcriptional regulator n=1 Tax=Streptomyces physcomitrii TaxID=2724184 RepID=A0ABX1H3R5_9ACTN|nr:XRE family transcriptional regulator [Streptomyces physcomitrii]NKI43002.1 helix-turn-helix transcriptional regulator [Streptomyces physcomitrii]
MEPAFSAAGDLSGVAARLRERRRAAGLTLEAASARAELSPAHLSRLETGQRQPSLPVLLNLARSYGTTVSDLLGETPAEHSPVLRAADAEATDTGGWTYRPAGNPSGALQALRVRVSPRAQRGLVRVHPGEEWLYVLSGRLALAVGERAYTLGPGDSAHFDSLVPHRIATATEEAVEMLFVHTLLRGNATEVCLGGTTLRTP